MYGGLHGPVPAQRPQQHCGAHVPAGQSACAGPGRRFIGWFLDSFRLIGFVGGVFAAEAVRLRDARAGWSAAWAATKAVGVAILIELGGGLIAATAWLGAVLAGV